MERLLRGSSLFTLALLACGDDGSATSNDTSSASASSVSTSGATSSAASTSSSGSGGHGNHECTTPADCTQTGTVCAEAICENNLCGLSFAPAGTPVPAQDVDGDCQATVCDGQGTVVLEADDADIEDDDNDCTADSCIAGEPLHEPEPVETPCASNGGGFCDAGAVCVECLDVDHCTADELCIMNQCVPPGCTDMTLNGLETDVDCGGIECSGCADTLDCLVDDDCLNDFCHPMMLSMEGESPKVTPSSVA